LRDRKVYYVREEDTRGYLFGDEDDLIREFEFSPPSIVRKAQICAPSKDPAIQAALQAPGQFIALLS